MASHYSKWDHIDGASSSSESEVESGTAGAMKALRRQLSQSGGAAGVETGEKRILISTPTDSFSEKIRWMLDRHQLPYEDDVYPLGSHVIGILCQVLDASAEDIMKKLVVSQDDKQLVDQNDAPLDLFLKPPFFKVTKDHQGQFYHETYDMATYIYSKALTSGLRIYGPPNALDLDLYFDRELAPAAQYFYHYAIFHAPMFRRKGWTCEVQQVAKNVLVTSFPYARTRVLCGALWPLFFMYLKWHRYASDATLDASMRKINEVFEKVEALLEQQRSRQPAGQRRCFIAGKAISAADISFASHAVLCLLPHPKDDLFADALSDTLQRAMPSRKDLDAGCRAAVARWRKTVAGQHAIQLYLKERKGASNKPMRQQPSLYAAKANPWWTQDGLLGLPAGQETILVILLYLVIAFMTLSLFIGAWQSFLWCASFVSIGCLTMSIVAYLSFEKIIQKAWSLRAYVQTTTKCM